MHKQDIKKNWNQWKSGIQKHWNKLTAEDLHQIDGMYDQLINRLMKKYGYSREVAEREIENWRPETQHAGMANEHMHENPQMKKDWETKKPNEGRKAEIHNWNQEQEGKKKQEQGWQQPGEGKNKKRKAG